MAEDFLTSYGTARAKEAHTRLLGILLPEAPPEVPEHYGWDIFQTDRVPGFELQKVEPVGKFADDLDAWKDVGQRVTARDIPTLNVLRFLEKYSPLEYNKISVYLKEVQSISLSDELRRG